MTNNYSPGKICKTVLLVFLFVNLYACNRDRNNPGWDYFPDMFYSTAYETYTKNPNFQDGMTMRVPVPGTVPRDFIPFEYTNDPGVEDKGGGRARKSVLKTREALLRGEEGLYHILYRMPWNRRKRGRTTIHQWPVPFKTTLNFRRDCRKAEGWRDISYNNTGNSFDGSSWIADKAG